MPVFCTVPVSKLTPAAVAYGLEIFRSPRLPVGHIRTIAATVRAASGTRTARSRMLALRRPATARAERSLPPDPVCACP